MSTTPTARSQKMRLLVALSAAMAATAIYAAYPTWQPDTFYKTGTIVFYQGRDYQALVDQTDYSGTGWTPTTTSLWKDLGPDGSAPPPPAPAPAPTPAPAPAPTPAPSPAPAPAPGCAPAWNSTTAYTAGQQASVSGVNYKANWWTQGQNPSTNNGPSGSGQPWTIVNSCAPSPAPAPAPAPTPAPAPAPTPAPAPAPSPAPAGFSFGPYKDVTVNMDWNTNVISTMVTGSRQPAVNVLPTRAKTITWAFASGECGSETWAGIQPSALVAANVQAFVNAGRNYIISTGGAAGTFTCGSDAGFTTFINRYNSANLTGIDFDIEGGQSQSVVDNLVQRSMAAQSKFPKLRFSFTIATLGGNGSDNLGPTGKMVMQSIKNLGMKNYIINLMVMDYGSTTATNCVIGSNGKCDMGQSANRAATTLHNFYGVPYSQIELTPMIGGNDTQDETFTLTDVDTLSAFVKSNGLAGVHFWSLDRDVDCPAGSASPTCNSYGQAGTWGFTNRFVSKLGL